MNSRTLRVSLIGSRQYSTVYQQALMTVLKAQTEGASKVEIITNETELALLGLLRDIARTVDLSADFGDAAISTVISSESLVKAIGVLGGLDGIRKRNNSA